MKNSNIRDPPIVLACITDVFMHKPKKLVTNSPRNVKLKIKETENRQKHQQLQKMHLNKNALVFIFTFKCKVSSKSNCK